MPMRTGYDSVVPHRIINDMWASIAQQDGVVENIRNNIMTVKHDDGTVRAIELGIVHGKWSGKSVPHEIVTDLKVGDKFTVGTAIARNKNWFKRDHLYPDQIILAMGALATVVLWEADDTYEDGCAITPRLAKLLETRFSETRTIRVAFDHDVRGLVKVGDKVDGDDLLCTLYPPLSSSSDRYDEVAQSVLAKLSNESPHAKVTGVIEDISVMYSGDLESMSPSLRHLVEAYDDALYRKCKQLKRTAHDASVFPSVQVEGQEIGNDQVIIQVKIGKDLGMGGGDKLVLCNQMKSVNGRIIDGVIKTKSGLPIDIVFGAQSVESRMVRSIHYIIRLNRILVHIGDEMVNAYFA